MGLFIIIYSVLVAIRIDKDIKYHNRKKQIKK